MSPERLVGMRSDDPVPVRQIERHGPHSIIVVGWKAPVDDACAPRQYSREISKLVFAGDELNLHLNMFSAGCSDDGLPIDLDDLENLGGDRVVVLPQR